jgi:polyisoprenoid-binding protein YceI
VIASNASPAWSSTGCAGRIDPSTKQYVNADALAIRSGFCQAAAMLPRTLISLATALLLAGHADLRAATLQTYVLDPVHTQIVFFADHLGFSHGIGRVRISKGWFQFDEDDWTTARADVVVDMSSLDMGEPAWSDKVRSPQFLDTAQWPTARFIGRQLEKTAANEGILHGELWLRGVRRDVDLSLTFNRAGGDPYAFKNKAGFTARTRLDRFDFGMQTYRAVVGAPVELRIEVEGVRSSSPPKETVSDAVEEH